MEETCRFWLNRKKEQCGKKATKIFKIDGMQPQSVCDDHYNEWMKHFGLKEKEE